MIAMSQWKEIEKNKPTGFLDKNGVEIKLGDRVSFRRKVRVKYDYGSFSTSYEGRRHYKVIPGHYKTVTAEVVGFGRIASKHYYNGTFIQIEYVNLQESKRRNRFRVYRVDNLIVIQ